MLEVPGQQKITAVHRRAGDVKSVINNLCWNDTPFYEPPS
jgi:hypothetical protein